MDELQIYQNKDGGIALNVTLQSDNIWLYQQQMADLFDTTVANINIHLKNIYTTGELDEEATIKESLIVRQEGTRQVKRKIKHYNLDAVISIGYRVNSKKATAFRIWATKLLKQHLLEGYTLSQHRLAQNATELEKALQLVKRAAALPYNAEFGAGLVDIISSYTQTFLWLQQYDEGLLNAPKGQQGSVLTSLDDAKVAIAQLKQQLISKGEATYLFANERQNGLAAIWGALEQSVFGEPAYPTLESKAAHLLYFVVKNHAFSDGNKRTAAFLFVDFLNRNQRLFNDEYQPVINDTGLAAITLLVAES
jgi:prophage maintenance system killer protein